MSDAIRLTVYPPAQFLNSNDRLHYRVKAPITKAWREAGAKAAAGVEPFTCPVHITATIHKTRGGRWDPNNAWPTVKALVDGIVDSQVLADDDYRHVIGPDMRRGEPGEPRIELTITPL